jgi:hypothetical protein
MRLRAGACLIAITFGAAATAQSPAPGAPVDLGGKLYRAVFTSGTGVLGSGDLAAVPEPQRSRLSAYLTRRAAFKSAYRTESDSFEKARADAKKRVIERAIVSLVAAPGIESAAAEFVADAPIADDWEKASTRPLEEAAYAETVLKKDPSSPLAPFLYVFIAHRQRAAFELAGAQKDAEAMKAASRKYRTFVQRARAVDDAIFTLLADDLDRQAYVYVPADNHPRDYNPDA